MRRKYCEDISLLGTLFVQEYISTICFVYVLCVYDTTDHILPVVCFYDFFVFNSSLHTVQQPIGSAAQRLPVLSSNNQPHTVRYYLSFRKGCLKDKIITYCISNCFFSFKKTKNRKTLKNILSFHKQQRNRSF